MFIIIADLINRLFSEEELFKYPSQFQLREIKMSPPLIGHWLTSQASDWLALTRECRQVSMYPVTRIDGLQYLLLLSWSHSESLPPMIDKLYTNPTRATREGLHDDNPKL